MAPVLNLNNEVVKMRKEVKKIRVLSIRKLTRHLAKLKSKKGTEEDIQRNQRRAQRLLEEIHAMKEVKPDDVTKTALQKEINFEKVCKMNGCSAEERAIARLATHPQFKKRIDDIKAAVKAFKEERQNPSEVLISEKCLSEEKPVQSLKVEVAISEPVGRKQKDINTKQKPVHGKKKNINVPLTPLPKVAIGNQNKALQSEQNDPLAAHKEIVGVDSNEIVPVSPKEDIASTSEDSNSSAVQDNMPSSPTTDRPAAPAENIPGATADVTPATLAENVSAAVFKSTSAIPKPDMLAATEEDAPTPPKEDVPSFATGEGIAKEGLPFLTNENMPASSIDRISIMSKDVSQKQKDKPHTKQTQKVSISQKGKSVCVQHKVDKSKVMDSDSSDMEKSDKEDCEYFDDSTEERFLRQSSGPDDSDSEDDFFLGKVKQTKKRKGTNTRTAEKVIDQELDKISKKTPLPMDSKDLGPETHKPNTKLQKLESVFCQSLAQSKPKATLAKRNIKEQPQMKKKAEFQRNKPRVIKHQLGNELTVKQDEKKRPLHSAKQDNKKHNFRNVKHESKIQHHLQQPLHPSWEASKKRKEQQSLITAFQGKKIRFDD